jgi:hypothetical protein
MMNSACARSVRKSASVLLGTSLHGLPIRSSVALLAMRMRLARIFTRNSAGTGSITARGSALASRAAAALSPRRASISTSTPGKLIGVRWASCAQRPVTAK